MSGKGGTAAVFVAMVLLSTVPASAQICLVDVCLRFDPSINEVVVGETFEVDIVADIVTPVVGWGLDLTIDAPGIISLVGDPAIPNPPWAATIAPDGDKLAALAKPSKPTNGSVSGIGIVLATLTFSADALGQTDLILGITPGDLTEGFALDPTGFATITFEPGNVSVIPEPTTLLLLLSVLSYVLGSARSRRRPRRRTRPSAGHDFAT